MKKIFILLLPFLWNNSILANDVIGTVTNATMPNCPDGAIELTISVGYPPFTFAWVGPNGFTANTEDVAGIKPGIYRVAVEDALCGRVLLEFEVKTDETKIYIAGKKNIPHCGEGGANFGRGSIDLEVTGSGFAYAWTGPNGFASSSQDIANLRAPGIYTVTVTNSAGCTKVLAENICCCSSDTGEGSCSGGQSTPGLIVTEEVHAPLTRASNDGRINLTISGGAPAVLIVWTGPNGFKAVTEDLSNLGPGNYCVAISDGCTQYNKCFNLVPCSESGLTINGAVTNTCKDLSFGGINTTVAGGVAPYAYQWSSGRTTPNLVDIPTGQFCVTIKDNYGCLKNNCFNVGLNDLTTINSTSPCARTVFCNNRIVSVANFPLSCVFNDPSDCRRENCFCTLTDQLASSRIAFNYSSTRFDAGTCRLFGRCPSGREDLIATGFRRVRTVVEQNTACNCYGCFLVTECFFPTLGGAIPISVRQIGLTAFEVFRSNDCSSGCIAEFTCNNGVKSVKCLPASACIGTDPKSGSSLVEARGFEVDSTSIGNVFYLLLEESKNNNDSLIYYLPVAADLSMRMKEYSALFEQQDLVSVRLLEKESEPKSLVQTQFCSIIPKIAPKSNTTDDDAIFVSASPNPFTEVLHIDLEVQQQTTAEIRIFNMLGVQVQSQFFDMDKGPNKISLATDSLLAGIYQLDIRIKGKTAYQTRVVRNQKQ